jgi:hypothetical protein
LNPYETNLKYGKQGVHMATYAEIQNYVREHYGFVAQTCWIADVLSDHGLTRRQAPNRINHTERKKPCPESKRSAIEQALIHFAMI